MVKPKYKPGQPAPKSGQYGVNDKHGKPKGTEVTATEGKPLPPTQKPGETYTLNDKTKHKDDKKYYIRVLAIRSHERLYSVNRNLEK